MYLKKLLLFVAFALLFTSCNSDDEFVQEGLTRNVQDGIDDQQTEELKQKVESIWGDFRNNDYYYQPLEAVLTPEDYLSVLSSFDDQDIMKQETTLGQALEDLGATEMLTILNDSDEAKYLALDLQEIKDTLPNEADAVSSTLMESLKIFAQYINIDVSGKEDFFNLFGIDFGSNPIVNFLGFTGGSFLNMLVGDVGDTLYLNPDISLLDRVVGAVVGGGEGIITGMGTGTYIGGAGVQWNFGLSHLAGIAAGFLVGGIYGTLGGFLWGDEEILRRIEQYRIQYNMLSPGGGGEQIPSFLSEPKESESE